MTARERGNPGAEWGVIAPAADPPSDIAVVPTPVTSQGQILTPTRPGKLKIWKPDMPLWLDALQDFSITEFQIFARATCTGGGHPCRSPGPSIRPAS